MNTLESLKSWRLGQQFLLVKYPIISGAMSWISNAQLVQAVSRAGGFGALACGNLPLDCLENEINKLNREKINFAANLITISPLYLHHLKKVVELNVPYIVFAGSFPKKEEVKMAKSNGAKVLCFASTDSIAQRMIDYGTDALILEGSEAGGHIGHISTIVLIQQLLYHFSQLPVFIAGGIATGRMIAHLFLMGAAGVQMGTIFAMSKESCAHEEFKKRYLKARSREAISTPQYDSSLPVVSVRAIKNKGTLAFGQLQLQLLEKLKNHQISQKEAQYQVENFWNGALRRAVQDGDIEYGSLMAGQSVGLVKEIKKVEDIMNELISDAEEEISKLNNLFT